jgi:hypothetical protein
MRPGALPRQTANFKRLQNKYSGAGIDARIQCSLTYLSLSFLICLKWFGYNGNKRLGIRDPTSRSLTGTYPLGNLIGLFPVFLPVSQRTISSLDCDPVINLL